MKKVNKPLLIASLIFAAFTVILVVALALGVTDPDRSIPAAVMITLLLCGFTGFIASLAAFIKILINTIRQKRSQPDDVLYCVVRVDKTGENIYASCKGEDEIRKAYGKYYRDFWDNLVLPDGFSEFLKEYGSGQNDKRIILAKDDPEDTYVDGINCFGLYSVYPAEKLKECNDKVILNNEINMYRDVVAFCDDQAGNGCFILDYEYGNEPRVKFLNKKRNTFYYLADSFKQFKEKLITAKESDEIIGKDVYR